MLILGGRVKTDDGFASLDLLEDKILVAFHRRAFLGKFFRKMSWDYHHAVSIADHNVSWEHGDVAARDGHVDVDRFVQGEVGGSGRSCVIGGHVECADTCGITEAAIGDDAGGTAQRQLG